MAEENTDTTMNLDLNLGPNNHHSSDNNEPAPALYPNVAMNLEEWLDSPVRVQEVFHQRNHRWRSLWRHIPIPPDTRNLALELIGGLPEAGEGSDSRPTNETKVCESATMEDDFDDSSGKKNDGGKNNTDEGVFFDCNICLDLAKDPVVTCCGHLFCWPCLYRWLHHHSDAKECPVCKGEVTMKNVTPIYGRGSNSSSTGTDAGSAQEPGSDSDLMIPLRPQARRVESWRQAIHRSAAFTIPMEEMIRRLGSTFDLSSELPPSVHSQSPDRGHESVDGGTSLLNRILMARGMRRERSPLAAGPEDIIEPIESYDVRDGAANDNNRNRNNVNIVINGNGRRMAPHFLRRSSSHRGANLAVALPSSGSLVAVESYFNGAHVERNEEVPPAVDDRDSVSSIAAVIHSESQTVDNAIEIDSTVSISTSSSRRRHDVSRISDVDSGDSRAPRRRRLN